jgi:D-lactate dehydrogenase (cytochrome)
LAGTAVLSATAGYLLANRETEKPGGSATDLNNTRYGTAEDFRKAIEELKATFPEPGAVYDDPVVVAPYGFSQNDYHPSESVQSLRISRVLMIGVF